MKISNLNLFLINALKSIRRNANNSVSSIVTVTLTLFILELFLLFMLNVKAGMIGIYSEFEVQVTLKDNIKAEEQQKIYNKIKKINGAIDITLENNFTTSVSYIIKANGPDDIPKIISQINGLQGINKIKGGQSVPRRILALSKIGELVGAILLIMFIVVSFFLIKNTIKIAIYPRRSEIGIMQYIGATDWFIRWSFILEEVINGFLGSILAVIIIYLLYSYIYKQVNPYLSTMFIISINPYFILTIMSWSFILIGIIISAMGTIFVMREFLID
ncbi:FtsX-like permease family protein [Clostridium drakei]|uniref:ABC transporter permease n=1 Tax=Clostridium drakei TaxID=332101 RepID=A0A2U8DL90_9CLOT|nr:FtsX-like permease family protein [Clostridium drakei]AWI03487.1 ABC transporter permease [Clostridium drakei]